MAEPTASKVTLMAALAALVGPLAAEYSVILAGALVGGLLSLSLREQPLLGIVRPLGHVVAGVALALLVAPLGVAVAVSLAPADWALPADLMLPVVALAVGVYWHRALTEWAPGIVERVLGRGQQ